MTFLCDADDCFLCFLLLRLDRLEEEEEDIISTTQEEVDKSITSGGDACFTACWVTFSNCFIAACLVFSESV
jgi:hypothetical protein